MLFQLPSEWLANPMISNYLRALHIQVPHVRKVKGILSLENMYYVSKTLDKFDNALVYRAAFLLSFYGFLRISNLVAPTVSSFDVDRQLCYRDVIMGSESVSVYLRWAKNLQRCDQSHVVHLPVMKNVYLCPYRALSALFQSQHYTPYDPVIKFPVGPVLESHLRKRFTLMLKILQLPTAALTYHALRRSGASLAFNNNVSFEGIKSQGSWQSDAVWQYLFANSHRAKEVANMFTALPMDFE